MKGLRQGFAIGGPRATSGPRSCFFWPAMNFHQGGIIAVELNKMAIQANSKDATKKVLTIGYTLEV